MAKIPPSSLPTSHRDPLRLLLSIPIPFETPPSIPPEHPPAPSKAPPILCRQSSPPSSPPQSMQAPLPRPVQGQFPLQAPSKLPTSRLCTPSPDSSRSPQTPPNSSLESPHDHLRLLLPPSRPHPSSRPESLQGPFPSRDPSQLPSRVRPMPRKARFPPGQSLARPCRACSELLETWQGKPVARGRSNFKSRGSGGRTIYKGQSANCIAMRAQDESSESGGGAAEEAAPETKEKETHRDKQRQNEDELQSVEARGFAHDTSALTRRRPPLRNRQPKLSFPPPPGPFSMTHPDQRPTLMHRLARGRILGSRCTPWGSTTAGKRPRAARPNGYSRDLGCRRESRNSPTRLKPFATGSSSRKSRPTKTSSVSGMPYSALFASKCVLRCAM